MDVVSFLATASVGISLLWFSPAAVRQHFTTQKTNKSSELETLTALLAAVHSARSYPEVWNEFKNDPVFKLETKNQLERMSVLVSTHGLSATLLLQQIVNEQKLQEKLQRRWLEGIAPAVTAAVLLALMPAPILATAAAGSLDIFDWMLVHPIGRITTGVGTVLVGLSFWRLRTANPFHKSLRSKGFAITNTTAGFLSAIAIISLKPDFFGALLALVVAYVLRSNWNRLATAHEQEIERDLTLARPRVVNLLAAAITAGAGWNQAVEIASDEVPAGLKSDWTAINQRIKWGVPVPQAFSEGRAHWQQIAVVVDQTLRTGAPLSGALFSLAGYWQEAMFTHQVNVLERKASRMIVFVTLIQLPAFILIGLVPLVAASLIPLFDFFVSTSA